MKFIKRTLLPTSKPSLNISALCINNESNQDIKIKHLEQQLQSEYESLKSQVRNLKHLPKYQAYLESFESLLDNKNNVLNKKIETLMTSLHFNGKKKQKQIPLLEAFLDFSLVQRYKFLIDLLKHAEQHQMSGSKQRIQSPYNSPLKKKQLAIQQSRVKIFSQASISLNQLKTMSLSYWTKVNFELNCQKRQIKVTGKQSFILYLQNYLVRLSKKEKYCFVLLCCNPEQVPLWLRKVYIHVKKEIFVQVFQGIWNQIILVQLQKMEASFQDVNRDIQVSPTKSIGATSINEDQFEVDKDNYLVFLTPIIIKNYMSEKTKFLTKIKHKLKFSLYKQIQFDDVQSQSIRKKLNKISFYRASDEKNKQIHQVRGCFNLPASVVKFKFIDSLKQRNKFITSWQILQNQPNKNMQAISQSFDFSQIFQSKTNSIDPSFFKFKQLSLKQEMNDFSNDQLSQILTLQSIRQISKTSVVNFVVVECEQKKNQKSELVITCEFNKHLLKRKIHKLKIESISKQRVQQMSKKLIQNFLKEIVLMIFTQQKMYEATQIHDDLEFFTICEAFDNDIDQLDVHSSKSIQVQEEFIETHENDNKQVNHQIQPGNNNFQQNQLKLKKSNSLNPHEHYNVKSETKIFNMKKTSSLEFNDHPVSQKHLTYHRQKPNNQLQALSSYLRTVFSFTPTQKPIKPDLVKQNLLAQEWIRLQEGGMTCINEKKIKQQKQIIKKILVKLGETILKQKNVMHVSLPVTIFKTQSQLTTVARGLTYAPLLLQPQHHMNNNQIVQPLERLKKAVVFLISNSYSQINFQKPFNPILGETLQCWIDGCPVYFEQISHHPPITYYYLQGRGYKVYGGMEPSLSMGINHAKVISQCVDRIQFDDGTMLGAGCNKMLVNGTTFGLRTFNFDDKNFVFDQTNNLMALFSYGPTKKGLFSNSSEPSDFIKGKIMKMSQFFKVAEYIKWKKSDYTLKKQWIQQQISVFQGIWSKKVFFDGVQYFDFDTQLPYQLVEQKNPLPSDSRYRQDLQWLIKGNLDKSQDHKQKLQDAQRYDKKLRMKHNK